MKSVTFISATIVVPLLVAPWRAVAVVVEAEGEQNAATRQRRALRSEAVVERDESAEVASTSTVKPPNLIVILTDDHGYHDVGFNGCADIPTPNLDSIAGNGIRFTRGYPICGPSRAGLLTGRYQDRFGFTANPTEDPNNPDAGIPLQEENIAEVLGKVGYKSAVVGKVRRMKHNLQNRSSSSFFFFGLSHCFPSS